MITFSDRILSFYQGLEIKSPLPEGVVTMNPYTDETSFSFCTQFYQKFYNDQNERSIILGINPGRHGGGVTGIPFTDPVKLEHYCNIPNPFNKKTELSADFIYRMIEEFGGPELFYAKFYFLREILFSADFFGTSFILFLEHFHKSRAKSAFLFVCEIYLL